MTRRLAIWLILAVVFAYFVTAAARAGGDLEATGSLSDQGRSFTTSELQGGDGSNVAIVHVRGVIINGTSDAGGSSAGGDDLVAMLRAIRNSDDYEGVILELDTPGGAVLASAEVADEVAAARKDGLKVVAWMRSTAASGGYYISANADRIVAAPSTITGSIGVIMEYPNVSRLADKIGVDPVVIKSAENKDIGSPFRDLSPEQRRILQSVIDEAYDDFVEVVSIGRDIPESRVREIADGRIYTGRQALDNDLVDELGTRDDAYDAMAKLLKDDEGEDLDVTEVEPSFGFFDLLQASSPLGGGKLGANDVVRLVGEALSGRDSGASPAARGARTGTGIGGVVDVQYRAVIG